MQRSTPTSYLFSSRAAVESAEQLGGLNVRHGAARNSVGHRNGRKLFQNPYRATTVAPFPDSGPGVSPQVAESDGVTREGCPVGPVKNDYCKVDTELNTRCEKKKS